MSLSRSLPAGDVFKARLILIAGGWPKQGIIGRRMETTAPTTSHYKKLFLEGRSAGLTETWPGGDGVYPQAASGRSGSHPARTQITELPPAISVKSILCSRWSGSAS